MQDKHIVPFLDALENVLGQFGATDIRRGAPEQKETMHVDMDVTAVLGLVGNLRGNVAYSLSSETAKKIVSAMMYGMPVEEIDSIARSAIGEMANMITGNAITANVQALLSGGTATYDITPPSIIFGQDIYFIISSVETIAVPVETSFGRIEVNIGLEM
ncbi:chemotaxis protein CheX [Heliobacterium gestii]|uniref:Chemotaxis protein CheX n=1 Tax=Heliomicrobium gestii TaxID=2699 RepID=A0A845L7C5_HELGE|nr:chemotaxis protein CheX [Heliomicrobium gestii]MBM7866076.1 chemotaxis protein CheX [Heliomicrobium gestii]MZP42597.1 chemotaxis protein CheX [Heliomicrobium gestii]